MSPEEAAYQEWCDQKRRALSKLEPWNEITYIYVRVERGMIINHYLVQANTRADALIRLKWISNFDMSDVKMCEVATLDMIVAQLKFVENVGEFQNGVDPQ